MLYFWLKLIHILSATLIFGTGMGSAFYMLRAHLSADDRAIAFASRNVVIADWIFTTPSIILQPLTGFWLMSLLGYPLTTPWLMGAIGLFILAIICWIPVVWLQIQIHKLAKEALKTGASLYQNPTYMRFMKIWFLLGWPAFIAIIIIFYLMVFKPQFNLI